MAVRYVCDTCGHRGVDAAASSADEVLCEVCGEPVLEDLDPDGNRHRRE
jgi:DNA-directed RNA polymerase subunit RPC12/RpoP